MPKSSSGYDTARPSIDIRAKHSLTSALVLAMLTPVCSQANILNEWSFEQDSNGSELIQAINSGSQNDAWLNTKPGYQIDKGRLIGENNADISVGQSRFNTGYFAKATIATPITSSTALRVDLSYDLSASSNDAGSIALFSIRDTNNKDWGIRLHYNVSNGSCTLQSGLSGIWQDLQSISLSGQIHAAVVYNLSTDTVDFHIDTTGSGTPPSTATDSVSNAGIAGLSFSEYRMHLTGDLIATTTPAVAVENIRHGDTLSDVLADVSYNHRLSPQEITWLSSEVGASINESDSESIAAIVKTTSPEQWRVDADNRIETYRKADLQLNVQDTYGRPVDGASIAIKLDSHDFVFGGILRAKHWAGVEDNIDTTSYKANALKFFNCFGLQNALKPKLQSGHLEYVDPIINWAETHAVPFRGHALIWPGSPSNDHLTATVRSKLDACHAAAPEDLEAAKADLAATIEAEIIDWVTRWDIYEWDLMNEPVTNNEIQAMLGEDIINSWFNIAKANAVNPNAGMLVNEYQIISAASTVGGWTNNSYGSRSTDFKAVLDELITSNSALDAIGFQSRFGWERTDPALLYTRLQEFAAYGLPMVGTEFEVKPRAYDANLDYEFAPTEELRAQITGEVLRTYYSHPSVYGFNAWTFYHDEHGFFRLDGTPKLNALVWYYMTKLQWHTSASLVSNSNGDTSLRGHLGSYTVSIDHAGHQYQQSLFLASDDAISLIIAVDSDGDGQLDDIDTDDDNDGYADTIDLYPTDSSLWNVAPTWTLNSFGSKDANEDQAYNAWINWRAIHPDEEGGIDTLTFSLVGESHWIVVAPNGNLSGTPSKSDVGTFNYTVEVTDGFNTPVQATLTVTVVAAPPEWSTLVSDDFEAGFGTFTGDGNDGRLYTRTTYARSGDNAALIRDDTNSSVVELANSLNVNNLLELKIDFHYRAESMETGESFVVEYWDGSTWAHLETYTSGDNLVIGSYEAESFTLTPASHTLAADFSLRFRCDASGNRDFVYIDDVTISGLE